MTFTSILFAALAFVTILNGAESSLRAQSSRQLATETILCRITTIDTIMDTPEDETEEYACIPIVDNTESDMLLTVPIPDNIATEYQHELASGYLFVRIENARATIDEIIVSESTQYVVINDEDHEELHRRRLQLQSRATGDKKLFIVRVSTPDSTPTNTLTELTEGMFSTGTSFKTQYEDCSFNQLRWSNAGGLDVMLDEPISTYTRPGQLVNAAQEKVKEALGIDNVGSLADSVVFCQPPGTQGWIAVAGVNHWRVNMSNDFCLSLSALMHEVGHNLGLTHSGEGNQAYGDKSGYMGYGTKRSDYPRKCFNGYKNAQMGWYHDRELEVADPSTPQLVNLAAFADYDLAKTTQPVLINVGGYHIQYNRAKRANLETEEKRDQVTITHNQPGYSLSVAGLDVNGRHEIPNFQGTGRSLVVEVCTKEDGGLHGADTATVSIGLDYSYCSQNLAAATPAPTSSPTAAPTVQKCTRPRKNLPCGEHSDCCSDNLRCLKKRGVYSCKRCRKVNKRCRNDSECCGGSTCNNRRCQKA